MKTRTSIITLLFAALNIANMIAQPVKTIMVDAGKTGPAIQPTMWGIFFEDINLAADGGLYAELVKNRSFEFSSSLMGWEIVKTDTNTLFQVQDQGSNRPSNSHFLQVNVPENAVGTSLSNAGFRGMGVKRDMEYHFSVFARQSSGSTLAMKIELVDSAGQVIGKVSVAPESQDWKKYSAVLISTATYPKARLNIIFEGHGTIDIDMVSLFPDDTWKNRAGGLRADLVQLLADLKPGFVRFPGGCIVEGRDLANRYQWKNSVGNVEERKVIINRWNTEFKHRLTPDYFQSFGLGFYEYFLLAEDIGAEPLPILNCGMACQFNTGELVPMDKLDPYIKDALDLIEFANGETSTPWGSLRAAMGHPLPFNLKMIGVGNEQWGPQYIERYKAFASVLKEKFPGIMLVSGTGPAPQGPDFEYAAAELKKLKADIVDEHYYANPSWFLENATRYDKYDRNGYKVFAGEYAAQSKSTTSPDNQNTWECALAEAAFMTGLERNADVVSLCSYAPLFAHVDGWQWKPDLIWFDNLKSFGTTNYYVQKLFSTNKGTEVIPLLMGSKALTGQEGLYGSAAYDKPAGEIILKLVNSNGTAAPLNINLSGTGMPAPNAIMTVMASPDKSVVNSLEDPGKLVPVERQITVEGKNLNLALEPYSLTVIRIKAARN